MEVVLHTEAEGRRELAQPGVLPSYAGGERPCNCMMEVQ